jgi:hypothetical protein
VPEDNEHRIMYVRIAVAKIRQAGLQPPSLGIRLFALATAEPACSSVEFWALTWQTDNEAKT